MTHDERSAIEDAYGLLWLTVTADPRIHEARKRLLSLLDKDGQKRGIQVAKNMFGPVTQSDILRMADDPDAIAAKDREIAEKEEARAEQWRLRRDADASRDAARAAADSMRMERDIMLAALRSIAAPSDCGCSPVCQCNSQESLSIEVEELRETARAALRDAEEGGE